MNDTPYELPESAEKLSYKFILDALKEDILHHGEDTAVGEAAVEELSPSPTHEEPPSPGDGTLPVRPLRLPVDKRYFRIAEVAELLGVEAYVLRYWESEFPSVRPSKTKNGHRVYGRKEVELLHLIEHLLHVEKIGIKEAKLQLHERRRLHKQQSEVLAGRNQVFLKELSHQLKELIHVARGNPGLG